MRSHPLFSLDDKDAGARLFRIWAEIWREKAPISGTVFIVRKKNWYQPTRKYRLTILPNTIKVERIDCPLWISTMFSVAAFNPIVYFVQQGHLDPFAASYWWTLAGTTLLIFAVTEMAEAIA